MPDRENLYPPVPAVTSEEVEAQNYLRRVRDLLWFVDWFLLRIHDRLRDPVNAEAMGTGEVPESLAFSLRGAVECARMDHAWSGYPETIDYHLGGRVDYGMVVKAKPLPQRSAGMPRPAYLDQRRLPSRATQTRSGWGPPGWSAPTGPSGPTSGG